MTPLRPSTSLREWTIALRKANIAVLPSSIEQLQRLREQEEQHGNVDAYTIAESIGSDPLMAVKIMTHVSDYCRRLDKEPPETLIGATVMLGIEPFFRTFEHTPSVDELLVDHPAALEGLIRVVQRARRAAHFASSFAIRRQDADVQVIQEAALMNDFAEMLLWCYAPDLALDIATQLAADHTLRSADLQRQILGIRLDDLARALMQEWQLPKLLVHCVDPHQLRDPKVRTVMLGVRLARHTQHGWDDPHLTAALPDDVADVAQLLTLSKDAALRLMQALDS